MRLGYGVDGAGWCVVVDDDRNPHEAISGKLTPFEAIVFISRIKRRYARSVTTRPCQTLKAQRSP